MKIIGEKINGTRKRVAQAVLERDAALIQDLAQKQAEAGAAWLDVNAGTPPDREAADLVWLIEVIQDCVETPLCLDSANPAALRVAVRATQKTPMINSISGETDRLNNILPIAAEYHCPVIALAMDGKKIPETAGDRVRVIETILEAARAHGLANSNLYVDPLAMTISTHTESANIALEVMRLVRGHFTDVHLTIGLSNISYGLPGRSFVNRTFLTLAMQAGLDSAILDPLDREMQAAILSTELLLGKDKHCMNYIRAARKGLFEKTE